MDKKRAAIVATAGVGLLMSAIFLRKWNLKRKDQSDGETERPIAVSDIVGKKQNHVADAV